MRTAVSRLTLLSPTSLNDALQRLQEDPELIPLAGCTDVYVALNEGNPPGRGYLNLWGISELRGIEDRAEILRIGALTTYTDLIRSPQIARRLPILAQASREVGGLQIQNRGTLGGNIANASPAGDTLPVLAVAEATIVLRSAGGERRVPFERFYRGYREPDMRPGELIVSIDVPRLEGPQWFRKVGTRRAQAISKVVMAALRGDRPRIALGSVAPTVVRLPKTEEVLAKASIDAAVEVLRQEIKPIDDLRSSAAYRLQVACNLLRQFWQETGNSFTRNDSES